jgi:S-DNA-T family DNA segregation ATPase FtsK/SpoIIIE
MTLQANKIIGWVGATFFENYLNHLPEDKSFHDQHVTVEPARFRLDQLTSDQIATIVREIVARPALRQHFDIKIPRALVDEGALPEELLFNDNASSVRNLPTDKSISLTASSKEHRDGTLIHITAVSAKELRSNSEAWVEACCQLGELALTPEDDKTFAKALQAMNEAIDLSLVQISNFCLLVIEANKKHGLPIRQAIGWALPSVGLPRDTEFFSNSKSFAQAVRPWRAAFDKLAANRLPLLKYQKSNGQPLDVAEMQQRLDENQQDIQPSVWEVLQRFIHGSTDDIETIQKLAEFEWEKDNVHLIFDRPKEKLQGIAMSTLQFFNEICDEEDAISDEWRVHLEDLKARERRAEWSDEDKQFFDLHRHYLEQDKKLYTRWEKAIFGQPIDCKDFLEGLVCATYQLLAGQEDIRGERYLKISVNKGRKAWLEQINHDVMSYFSLMYRGVYALMDDQIVWNSSLKNTALADILFAYDEFIAAHKQRTGKKFKSITSTAKAALHLKFEVALMERDSHGTETALKKIQLIWTYTPSHIGMSLSEDLGRLLEKGGIACTQVYRRVVSKKGGVQSVSLDDVSTLEATFSSDSGSLVPSASKLSSLRAEIKRRTDQLRNKGWLNDDQHQEIRGAWKTFEESYAQALNDFHKVGLHAHSTLQQADAYAQVLDVLLTHARTDVCRVDLVAEVLSVGTVQVIGDQPTLIIPPWHPERMKALAVKTQRTCALLTHLLNAESVKFGNRDIFFKEFFEELSHPFYPEVAMAKHANTLALVTATSTVNGYSLLELPVKADETSLSDTSPLIAAKQVRELIERYVGLQPHKLSHLNVLLYNTDAADLPLAVVKELSGLYTSDHTDMQCSLSVRHTDAKSLSSIYAELVNKSADDVDLPLVSEISDNFISKLRVGVSKSSHDTYGKQTDFKPFDIAFLHDVVSRTATIAWIAVPWSDDRSSLEHAPSRWSYRKVAGEGDLKSTTFLTCPWQTSTGWSYLAAVAALDRKDPVTKESRLIPTRQISLQHPVLAEIMDDAHQQAEWVATYDELLDKKQLQHRDITVVRYRRDSTNGRNMIVSSTADLRLLGGLTRRRLSELSLSFDQSVLDQVTQRIKKDALSISGQIVLRAARRGVSAGEMLGLVLSRYLIADELRIINPQGHTFSAFFLLDDYASWLSQKENRIADLLALSVEETVQGIRLYVAIVESKYVSFEGVAEARRASKNQLMSTLKAFRDALFGDPSRLDRDIWLSRLSDLLVDVDVPIGQTALLEQARVAIREGKVDISLRGYSHVFVHSADVACVASISEQTQLDSTQDVQAWQEVFDRAELRALIEAYAKQEDASPIRTLLGSAEPWEHATFQQPAPRVNWVLDMQPFVPKAVHPTVKIDESNPIPLHPVVPIEAGSRRSTAGHALPEHEQQGAQETPVDTTSLEDDADSTNSAMTRSQTNLAMSNLADLIASKQSATTQDAMREAWAEQTTKDLKKALNGWGFQVNVIGTRMTPNGCLVRLAGSDRLRVEDIDAKRMQLLTTHAINVVTVQPKPAEIVVTIASEKRQAVSLWDLWARRQLNRNAAGINVSFVIGVQEVNGELLYLNFGGDFAGLSGHEPHSLVAGATGSGKSVLLQVLLLDIAATNPKELAQIVLIDPKMGVDYAALADVPHMREPIITTKERATEVLASLVEEMEGRYRLFAQARARDLATYNAKVTDGDKLPMVFLVHDEFADWMFDANYKDAVGAAVQRLGVKARAAGIHLIFAAQRPDKDVMPMQLRENLGNRLILKVASEATSKIALDRAGAERLLGRGHLAAKLNGDLIFAQVPFVSDSDIERIVENLKIA